MTPKEQAAMQQALGALDRLKRNLHGSDLWEKHNDAKEAITALREALDHSADTGNKVSDHIAGGGKVIPQFIPVGIVNDHHSINWMEEIVEDQAPIGAILYALQDSVGRNVSFADESVCNWRQPTYDHSDANYWDADCGKSWAITEGTPTANGMKFCHGCGKPIKEHPFVGLDITWFARAVIAADRELNK